MRITNVYSKTRLTPDQKAKEAQVRKMFQDWKPGPEELLESGRWAGPIMVEGQEEFRKAIRRVRSYRAAQGLTLKDISTRCGIDVATLSKLENGKQTNPTLFTMLLYVGAVGKRLHFAIGERQKISLQISERRDAGTRSKGVRQGRAKGEMGAPRG